MGASIECREPFLDPKLIVGLGSLGINYFYKGKFKFIRNAMQDRLPDEILKFRKVGLSAPWVITLQSPAFKTN
jgi:asparagine synthase (glutamine-hydrolysing)